MLQPSRTRPDIALASLSPNGAKAAPQWLLNEKRTALFDDTSAMEIMRRLISLWHGLGRNSIINLTLRAANSPTSMAQGESDLPSPRAANRHDICGPMPHYISAHMLHCAYQQGLMPDYIAMTPIWSSPHIRYLYDPLHIEHARQTHSHIAPAHIRLDEDFEQILRLCIQAAPLDKRNLWLTKEMKHHFATLYDLGLAHCFEVQSTQGNSIAGGFGIMIGHIFILESVFGASDHLHNGLMQMNPFFIAQKYQAIDVTRVHKLVRMNAEKINCAHFLDYLPHIGQTEAKKWFMPNKN